MQSLVMKRQIKVKVKFDFIAKEFSYFKCVWIGMGRISGSAGLPGRMSGYAAKKPDILSIDGN